MSESGESDGSLKSAAIVPTVHQRYGFLQYYWECCKHFGNRVWESKGTEFVSALILSLVTGAVSWAFGQADAFKAFEIAVISLFGWLAIFALGHLIRTPWLVHRRVETEVETHWGFGVLGIAIAILMIGGLMATGLWFYQMREPHIDLPSSDPGAKDAQLSQLEQKVRDLEANKSQLHGAKSGAATVDILCRRLAACPGYELRRRAMRLADDIDSLYQQGYKQYFDKMRGSPLTGGDTQEQQNSAILADRDKITVSEYRSKYQGDAFAYRQEMVNRLGQSARDPSLDMDFESGTPGGFLSSFRLQAIATELRNLAAQLQTKER